MKNHKRIGIVVPGGFVPIKSGMRLMDLIDGLGVTVVAGCADVAVTGLADDSRRVMAGDLFIARPGSTMDGRRFIQDAVARGAVGAVAERSTPSGDAAGDGNSQVLENLRIDATSFTLLTTSDVGEATVRLARRFHGDPASKLKLIGVTGTNGKTTTTYMIRHLLAAAGVRCGLIGTVEIDTGRGGRPSDLTTPGIIELMALLAEMVRNGCSVCVMEVSSHALDQGRTRGLDFAVGAFTNLTGDHLDYHKTMEAYGAAKARLFESLSAGATAVVNADDPAAERMLRGCRARRLTFGGATGVDCRVTVHRVTARDTDCSFDGPWGALRVTLPLIGRHNVANMATALGSVHGLGVDVMGLKQAIERSPQVPGRLERVAINVERGTRSQERREDTVPSSEFRVPNFDVFVDYAHTDDALANVLRALRTVTTGKLRVMFGCGGDRDATKRPRMAKVACELADEVIVTSDNPRTEDPSKIIDHVLAGVPGDRQDRVGVEPDRAAAIERIIADAGAGDVVLLAGKGHEDYQIIGAEKRPFDDRLVARSVIERRIAYTRHSADSVPASLTF